MSKKSNMNKIMKFAGKQTSQIYDPFAKKIRIEGQPFDDGIDNPFAQMRKNNGIKQYI